MKYKRKKRDKMAALAIEKKSLKDFISQHKKKIYSEARNNTTLNTDGRPTISKNDPWFDEDEWDEHLKRMDSK